MPVCSLMIYDLCRRRMLERCKRNIDSARHMLPIVLYSQFSSKRPNLPAIRSRFESEILYI